MAGRLAAARLGAAPGFGAAARFGAGRSLTPAERRDAGGRLLADAWREDDVGGRDDEDERDDAARVEVARLDVARLEADGGRWALRDEAVGAAGR